MHIYLIRKKVIIIIINFTTTTIGLFIKTTICKKERAFKGVMQIHVHLLLIEQRNKLDTMHQ